jgi:hypothetical protein
VESGDAEVIAGLSLGRVKGRKVENGDGGVGGGVGGMMLLLVIFKPDFWAITLEKGILLSEFPK